MAKGYHPNDISAIIMAGGKGTRLSPLTLKRSKPALHFGGKYRLIDFVLSNCVNSNIRRIAVITQYQSNSLITHCFNAWGFLNSSKSNYIEILPASQQHSDDMWYRGTADSVSQNMNFFKSIKRQSKYTLVLASDHIYKMDYSIMIQEHIKSGAPCTLGCVIVPKEEGSGFGIMDVDSSGMVKDWIEKPKVPPTMIDDKNSCLASMGIYVFDTDFLINILEQDFKKSKSSHDFGKDIIPSLVKNKEVHAHKFPDSCVKTSPNSENYWRDVGTVDAYWKANIELTDIIPEIDLYDINWPINTFQEIYQPTKFIYNDKDRCGHATDSIISAGCVISGGKINKSVIFNSVRMNSYSEATDSVIMPGVNIGRNCKIRKAIIESSVSIPENTQIGYDEDFDRKNFSISENGVVVVTKAMINKINL